MKSKIFLIIFAVIILITFIFVAIYLYMYLERKATPVKNTEINVYVPEEKIDLSSNVEPFLFTEENVRLMYEGGPVHWGSRTVTFKDMNKTEDSKIINLHIVDESDMKGEDPKKEWNQKWEAKSDGTLYVDNVLMLKSPIVVGQKWNIIDYTPVLFVDKKYNATVKIISIINDLNDLNFEVKKIYTSLTIDDIKTVDGGAYTETRVFESGVGLKEFKVTEPTISDFTLGYWLYSSNPIK